MEQNYGVLCACLIPRNVGEVDRKSKKKEFRRRAISLFKALHSFFKAPGPAVWGYGLWGSVGWDRAIFN